MLVGIGVALVVGALFLFSIKVGTKSVKVTDPKMGSDWDLNALINKASRTWGVEVALIKAIIKQESNWDIYAKNPSDPSYGLMEITPGVASDYGYVKDPYHPTDSELELLMRPDYNIDIGTRHLSVLMYKYKAMYGLEACIQMYNCGPTGYIQNGVRVPNYSNNVMKYYQEYKA